MKKNKETIEDIVREMRKDMPRVVDTKVILRNYADRIEAAAKREVGVAKMETTTQSVTDCNQHETVDIESRCIYGEVTEHSETVADVIVTLERYIICELRANDFDKSNIQHIIARLRRAHGKEVEQYAQANRYELANMAKVREALVQCELFLGNVSRHGHSTLNPGDKCTACAGVDKLRGMVVRALAAPARNCDRFGSWREANAEWWKYEVLPHVEGVVSGTEQPFEEWLFAEAKGEKK